MAVPSGRYRFTGREFESITGFQYHRARYYDPATGRWTSQDPLGLLADINPYRYAGNSPTNFIDPDGQLFLPIPLLFGAAVLAVLLQPQIANAPSQTDVPTGRNDFGLALLGSVEATALLTPASIGLRGTTAAVASAPTRRWALLALSERVIGGGAGAVEGVLQAQAGGGSAADQLIAGVLGFGFGLISPRAAFSSFATASAAGAVGGIIGGRPGARVGFQVGGLIGAFGHTLTSAAVAARGQGATRALLTGLRGVAPEAASAGLGAVVFPELLGVDPLTGAFIGVTGLAGVRGATRAGIAGLRRARQVLRRMPRAIALDAPGGHTITRRGSLFCINSRIRCGTIDDAAEALAGRPPGGHKTVDITISRSRFPETAKHIEDAQRVGKPAVLTIDRGGVAVRRAQALAGRPKVPGKDLDEYPPAIFKEGGTGASVREVEPSDNRGAGAAIGNLLRKLPDGAKVRITVGE